MQIREISEESVHLTCNRTREPELRKTSVMSQIVGEEGAKVCST